MRASMTPLGWYGYPCSAGRADEFVRGKSKREQEVSGKRVSNTHLEIMGVADKRTEK